MRGLQGTRRILRLPRAATAATDASHWWKEEKEWKAKDVGIDWRVVTRRVFLLLFMCTIIGCSCAERW